MVWVLVPDRPVWVFFTNCWSTGIVTTSQPSLGFYRRWSEEREYAVTSSSLDWCQGSGENGQSGIGWQKGNSNTGSPKLGIIGLGGCFHLMAGDRSQEEKSSFRSWGSLWEKNADMWSSLPLLQSLEPIQVRFFFFPSEFTPPKCSNHLKLFPEQDGEFTVLQWPPHSNHSCACIM